MAGKRYAIIIDTAKRRQTVKNPKWRAEDFLTVVYKNADAMVVLDHEGYILFANPAAKSLFNLPAAEIIGACLGFPVILDEPVELQILREFKDLVSVEMRMVEVIWAGEPSYLLTFRDLTDRIHAEQGIDEAGDKLEAMVEEWTREISNTNVRLGHEIAERKRTEEALRGSEERLRLAQQVIRMGTFDWNVRKGVNTWTPELESMYGLPPGGFSGTQEAWEQLVHPEDRPEVRRQFIEAMDKGSVEGEWRVIWPDGTVHWIFGRTFAFKDKSEKLLKLIGINIDITDHKRYEEAQRESEENFHSLTETSPAMVLIHQGGKFLYANTAAEAITGYSRDELLDMDLRGLIAPEHQATMKIRGQARLRGKFPPPYHPVKILTKHRKEKWLELTSAQMVYKDKPATMVSAIDVTRQKQDEEALRESEANLDRAQRLAALGNWEWDLSNNRLSGSREFYHIFGLEYQESTALEKFSSKLHPDDRKRMDKFVKHIPYGGLPNSFEFRIMLPDDSVKYIGSYVEVVYDENRRPVKLIGTVHDVTARKKAEKALRESEELFRALAESTHAGIVLYRGDKFIYANPIMLKSLGYSKDELLAMNCWDIAHPDCRELVRDRGRERLQGLLVPSNYEVKVMTKGGRTLWAEFSAAIIDYQGQPTAIATIFDITDRKLAEEALRKSESDLKRAQAIAHLSSWEWDLVSNTITGSEELYHISKHTLIPGMSIQQYIDMIAPDDKQRVMDALDVAIKQNVPCEIDFKVVMPDGTRRFIHAELVASYEHGKPVKVFGIAQDITERKQAEEELRDSEDMFRALAESSPAMVLFHQGSKFLYANPAAEAITGYSRDELLNMDFWELIAPKDQDIMKARGLAQLEGENPSRYNPVIILTRQGEEKWIELSSARMMYRGRPAIMVTALDITERRKAEREVRDSQMKYQAIIDANVDFIWETDVQGRYTYCSPQIEKLWGIKPEEMIGKTPFDVMPAEARERGLDIFKKMTRSPIPFSGLESISYDGHGDLIYVEISGVPFFDDNGALLGYRGITRDITDRKRA